MPTPWDYTRHDVAKESGEAQPEQGPTYPEDFSRSMMTGQTETDRQETSTRPSDPLELQAEADASADRFRELQAHLQSSGQTIGSRQPGAGENPCLGESAQEEAGANDNFYRGKQK